ncbi:hypothetical protein ES708_21881 [subsurface metagenome]
MVNTVLREFKAESIVLISAAIKTAITIPVIPTGKRRVTIVMYASSGSFISGNRTKQITPGKMNNGRSRIFNQPVKLVPNCPCVRFFAPSTD